MERARLDAVIKQVFRGETVFPNHVKTLFAEVRSLLEQGVHPDKIVRPGDRRPLLACMSELPAHALGPEFIALYQELVARGASVNKAVRGGQTPLSLLVTASGFGTDLSVSLRESLLACLLDAGADPGACMDSPLCSLIGFGSMKGDIHGAIFDEVPGTPKYDAFWSSVQRLLDAGADINAFERRGLYNPLLMAAICGSEHAVQRLIALGADPAVVNKDGNTALMYAAGDADGLASIVAGISCMWTRRGDTLAVTRLLLAHGVDPTLSNTRKRTALSIALRNDCVDVAYAVAEALAAKGHLTAQDLKGFKGTAYEAQAAPLPTAKRAGKPPAPKDTSGAAQLASWEQLLEIPTEEGLLPVCKLVREQLDASIQRQVFATYDWEDGLLLSIKREPHSRAGCIDIRHADSEMMPEDERAASKELVLRYLVREKGGDRMETCGRIELQVDASGLPDATALKDALTTMLSTQLGVVDNVADAGVVDSH